MTHSPLAGLGMNSERGEVENRTDNLKAGTPRSIFGGGNVEKMQGMRCPKWEMTINLGNAATDYSSRRK